MEVMNGILKKDDLPVPMALDSNVLDSKDPVFSDKLALFYVVGLFDLGIAVNGISLSRFMRHDLALTISRLLAEIGQYAEDGINIMIKNR